MTGPYGQYWMRYRRSGWHGLLPMNGKVPLVAGHHGRIESNPMPSDADLSQWREEFAGDNIAIRIPPGVFVLDVDAYEGRPGGETLKQLSEQCGPLPATWRSSARPDDEVSGTYWFTVPPEWRPADGFPGIDAVWVNNRYAVVEPSVHKSGNQYRWYFGRMGDWEEAGIPDVPPELPVEWLAVLEDVRDPQGRRTVHDSITVYDGPSSEDYGVKVLEQELARIETEWTENRGEFNRTLNHAAFSLGQISAGGELNASEARQALEAKLIELGVESKQYDTLDSGWFSGLHVPRPRKDLSPEFTAEELSDIEKIKETDRYKRKLEDRVLFRLADEEAKILTAPGNKELGSPTDWRSVVIDDRDYSGAGLLVQPSWVTLAMGDYESAKTMVFLWIAAQRLRAGETVVFIDEESTVDQTLDKLSAFNLSDEELSRFKHWDHPGWNLVANPGILDELIQTFPDTKLFGIDSYSRILEHSGLDDDNDSARRMFTILSDFANRYRVATYLIDHQGHGGSSHARGATTKVQQAHIALQLKAGKTKFTKDRDGLLAATVHKHRSGKFTGSKWKVVVTTTKPGPLTMEWIEDGSDELLERPPSESAILGALRKGPMPATAISAKTGIKSPRQHLSKLAKEGMIVSVDDPASRSGAKLWKIVDHSE